MSFREIVVDASPRRDVRRALEVGDEMAAQFGARLSVVSYAWPQFSMTEVLAPGGSATRGRWAMEEALAPVRSAFEEVFGAERADIEWCSGISEPTDILRDHLLTADLLITSSSDDGDCLLPDPADLAVLSGAPVLRLARNVCSSRFARVLVAWKDGPQSRRALHAALPLLERAESVEVVGVGDEVSAARLEAVTEHLRLHKAMASWSHIPSALRNVSEDLFDHAQRHRAELIVAGVYSRGPLAERLLGGVTRDMLKSMAVSWFLAH